MIARGIAEDHSEDPSACVAAFLEAGVRRLFLVNLDANRGIDDPRSRRAIRAALNSARDAGAAVDITAGVRSRAAAEFWIESGASSVVLGSIAVYRPDIAGEICRAFPGQIMLGLDVRGDLAHSDGWIRDAGEAATHLRRWSRWPAMGVLRTSLASDGRLLGPELDSLRRCIEAYPLPLLANGGARSLADLAAAAAAGTAAVVLTLADDNGTIDLGEAARLFPGRDLSGVARPT